ncbi:hypothetical protein [Corallococcus macrosporus]|uniref:Uncharacterized protein n=2 Tax=Myxococcaceae TaxID=31 RepID=A0A250JUP0_9BACT|nr:hypothetical protein [Corallococcus macrosporus]AEI66483.1 hypothetical protein LILAB_22940 [Corallococcus macrosporus]ATB47378.1 hypothetical protein MYMAC_002986 [Corallococcus macrosporus DSM 14697]
MTGPGLQLPKDDPRSKVLNIIRPPAFFLLCVGVLNVIYNLAGFVLAALKVTSPFVPAGAEASTLELSPTLALMLVVGILCGVLSAWGAISALNLKGYGLATVGGITALYILSPGCVIGVPVAVWMLFTLRRDGVREAFQA